MDEPKVFDALGLRMFVGQEVAYAALNDKGEPTICNGHVTALEPGRAKVYRMAVSSVTGGLSDAYADRDVFWVDAALIIGIDEYDGGLQ